jgi:DnaJ family protein C protein 28
MADIEEHIRKAIDEGKFENLPGQGKPLKLEDNSLEDPEWRLAYHVLREGGFSLPWIEMRREIDEEIETSRQALRRAWEWRQEMLVERKWAYTLVEEEWRRVVKTFEQKIDKINKRILDYNLQTPAQSLQLMNLRLSDEIEKATNDK